MKEKNKKNMMTLISRVGTIALSSALADKIIAVPEQPGIKDDIKEAVLKAAFTIITASIASILIRDFTR